MNSVPDFPWTKAQAGMWKAIWAGQADAATQRVALKHLLEIVCGINQVPFDPSNTHMTAFHSGRQWVARQIQNVITLPLDQLVKEEPHEPVRRSVPTATALAATAGRRVRRLSART